MKENLFTKIIRNHLISGEMEKGQEIAITIDQTLTQDATGTMAYLSFEALDIPRVRTKVSVSYVDHNTLQTGFENADDHLFLQSIAKKYGLYYSRPGNGICHRVHVERFAVPGQTLLGSDSHTPTSSALGMIAIGAGGMSVAMAMAGEPFHMVMPEVINVVLKGKLRPGVAAKDVILELLRILTVKGGAGKVVEYSGPGVQTLNISERATITNMGAELGVTTSIFQSDEITREFMKKQGREKDWIELKADEDAEYDRIIEINLDELEPLVAKPHMPDLVVKASELEDVKVNQVFIGSCTNASYEDLARAAAILEGKVVHPDVSLCVAPGSKQVFEMICKDGILQKFIASGARILECACGPCIGIGQSPNSKGVSVRTNNRNFIGRSGTADGQIYLVSPEVAAATAIYGKITDPLKLEDIDKMHEIKEPDEFIVDDNMLIAPIPLEEAKDVEIKRGPNIAPLPVRSEIEDYIEAKAILKVGDNITTDDIMPAGSKILPLRSNVPAISEYVFKGVDADFAAKAKEAKKSFVIGGENYGQGSSREHAALAPMYLGVQAILAKSFARIHKDNLINYGILPLVFNNKEDYDKIDQNDMLEITGSKSQIEKGAVTILNKTKGLIIETSLTLSQRQLDVLLAGGQLNYLRKHLGN